MESRWHKYQQTTMGNYHLLVKPVYSKDWVTRFSSFLDDMHESGFNFTNEGNLELADNELDSVTELVSKYHLKITLVKL